MQVINPHETTAFFKLVLAPSPGTHPLTGELQVLTMITSSGYGGLSSTPSGWWGLDAIPDPSWYVSGNYVWAYVQSSYTMGSWATAAGKMHPQYAGTTTEFYLNANSYFDVQGNNLPGTGYSVHWTFLNEIVAY